MESLTRSRSTNDHEPRCFMGDSISEVEISVNDMTSPLEKKQSLTKQSRRTLEQQLPTTARRGLIEVNRFF